MVMDMYISENPEQTPECRKGWKKNQATYEKNKEEKKALLERLGVKKPVLEKQREVLQKQKEDLDRLIEGHRKTIADIDSLPYEREVAEARIEQREKEREWVSERLKATERDLGLFEKKIQEI